MTNKIKTEEHRDQSVAPQPAEPPGQQLLYLSQADVQSADIPLPQIIDAVENGFRKLALGAVDAPPKTAVHPTPDTFLHSLPGYIRGQSYAGLKWVSGFPENPSRGLPQIAGLMILNDATTGMPVAVMDCAWITAARTGAATAVAAKYLARRDSKSVAILGCGVQARSSLLALATKFSFEHVFAYDKFPQITARFAEEMGSRIGVPVEATLEARQAVKDAQIVVTAGPITVTPHATIETDWLLPGVTLLPLDRDSFFQGDVFSRVDECFITNVPQYALRRTQDGYLEHLPPFNNDLGQVIAGHQTGRRGENDRILCLMMGLAVGDLVVAQLVYEAATCRGVGTKLPL